MNKGSTRTLPVKYSGDPFTEGEEPALVMTVCQLWLVSLLVSLLAKTCVEISRLSKIIMTVSRLISSVLSNFLIRLAILLCNNQIGKRYLIYIK